MNDDNHKKNQTFSLDLAAFQTRLNLQLKKWFQCLRGTYNIRYLYSIINYYKQLCCNVHRGILTICQLSKIILKNNTSLIKMKKILVSSIPSVNTSFDHTLQLIDKGKRIILVQGSLSRIEKNSMKIMLNNMSFYSYVMKQKTFVNNLTNRCTGQQIKKLVANSDHHPMISLEKSLYSNYKYGNNVNKES